MGFTAAPQDVEFTGLLVDMDGTIIDSSAAVAKHWYLIAADIGADPVTLLETSHGRRTIDTLGLVCPEKANWEYVQKVEALLPTLHGSAAVEIAGSRDLLSSITSTRAPWAIVTSATAPLVKGWFDRMQISLPEHLVTAESVAKGKPDPACYVLGLEKLNLQAERAKVVVLEDSPNGIKAGKAAGCKVIALTTTHTLEQVRKAEPDWILEDLTSLKLIRCEDGIVTLRISDAFVQA